MYKARTTFRSCDVQKVHVVVARSTFRSQNVQSTPRSNHFWKLRCRKSVCRCIFLSQNVQNTPRSEHFSKLRCSKSARRCGAKHISKSKCTKHASLGALLEVEIFKKCTLLWREGNTCSRRFWTLKRSFVAGARDSPPCQKWAKCEGFVAFPKTMAGLRHLKRICKGGFRAAGAVQKLHSTPLRYNYNCNYYYTKFHYTTLITLHYAPLHYTTLNYATLHYTPLHYTNYNDNYYYNYTTLHYTTLHYTTLHSTSLHYTTVHSITARYT